eukprot:2004162-Pyramimonas_sp.AAC.1
MATDPTFVKSHEVQRSAVLNRPGLNLPSLADGNCATAVNSWFPESSSMVLRGSKLDLPSLGAARCETAARVA